MAKQIESQKAQSTKLMHISISLAVGIFSAVILSHMAYLKNMQAVSIPEALIQSLQDITELKDCSIFPLTVDTFYGIMAGAGVGLLTFFFLYNEYERFRHYTTDEECGSAAFNDMGKDMIKFSMEYAEPFGKKKTTGQAI